MWKNSSIKLFHFCLKLCKRCCDVISYNKPSGANTYLSSDWLLRFLIIICSIFIQSSDWLLRFLIIICCNFKILHDLEIEKLNFGSLKINENNFAWHLIWYYISSKQSWLQASNWQNNLQKIQIKFLHLWHHQGCVIIFFVLGRNWNWVDQYFCLKWQTNAMCYLKTEVS